MHRIGFVIFTALTLAGAEALPCGVGETIGAGVSPRAGQVVGAMPLIVSNCGEPALVDDSGAQFALVADTQFAADVGAEVFSLRDNPLCFFRPTNPLPAGAYQVQNNVEAPVHDVSFTVDPLHVPTASPTDGDITMRLELLPPRPRNASPTGCVDRAFFCGGIDRTALVISLNAIEVDMGFVSDVYLVELTQNGERRVYMVTPGNLRSGVLEIAFAAFTTQLTAISSEATCVRLTGFADDGSLGETHDLGCVDPNDRDDPRVSRPEDESGGGCSQGGGQIALWLFTLLSVLVRWRRNAGDRTLT